MRNKTKQNKQKKKTKKTKRKKKTENIEEIEKKIASHLIPSSMLKVMKIELYDSWFHPRTYNPWVPILSMI